MTDEELERDLRGRGFHGTADVVAARREAAERARTPEGQAEAQAERERMYRELEAEGNDLAAAAYYAAKDPR